MFQLQPPVKPCRLNWVQSTVSSAYSRCENRQSAQGNQAVRFPSQQLDPQLLVGAGIVIFMSHIPQLNGFVFFLQSYFLSTMFVMSEYI